jgi:hypothetical protein
MLLFERHAGVTLWQRAFHGGLPQRLQEQPDFNSNCDSRGRVQLL